MEVAGDMYDNFHSIKKAIMTTTKYFQMKQGDEPEKRR